MKKEDKLIKEFDVFWDRFPKMETKDIFDSIKQLLIHREIVSRNNGLENDEELNVIDMKTIYGIIAILNRNYADQSQEFCSGTDDAVLKILGWDDSMRACNGCENCEEDFEEEESNLKIVN